MACRRCRSRKVKCDRTRPSCKNCMQRGHECSYSGERRKPNNSQGRPIPHVSWASPSLGNRSDVISISSSTGSEFCARATATDGEATPETLLDQILDGDDVDPLKDRHAAIWMRVDDAEEYSGPSSGIAGISDLGLKWIWSHVPDCDEVCRTIQYVRDGLMTHLRQCIPPQPVLDPEMPAVWKALPPPEVVREYVDAYFATVQTVFPVIDADIFEERLTQWYEQPSCQSDSWKALLNAVLASGCRAALSNDTASAFQESGTQAWGFFRNALNYEPKLVHSTTDLVSVQALVVMAVFAQGMSCSQRLEYTLCSTAARLAHSLALHRHVPKQWQMSDREQRERQRLFWVIYCLDKSIALRSGRPPVIHDEDISCPFPRDVRYGTAKVVPEATQAQTEEPPLDFFLYLVKFYRICSLVIQRLYSTVALCQSTRPLHSAADEILTRLETWCESIPARFRPGQPISRLPVGSSSLIRMQVLVLHFSYYYGVCAVHRRFTPMFLQANEEDDIVEWSPQGSSITHIEAARLMALLTKYLDIESYTPAWLLFYYPTTALATIFMHTVTTPLSVSANSDIALMEAVAGFFGRLEFMTFGEAAFTKTSEFARQARRIVAKAVEQNQNRHHTTDTPNYQHPSMTVHDDDGDLTSRPVQAPALDGISTACTAPMGQQNLSCAESQVAEYIMHGPETDCNHPDFGGSPPNFRNMVTGGVSLSFGSLPDAYWSDEWLAANRLDLV
ncbi:hypothetical protein FE257_008253 [Aspergillus nanangensis]|uniref:Zn(2)-C6 fungal-type domain-containing protein n=1 Tax=Aspergillus nanangensis TaxID=2582783 RepID=A0AAD4GUX2_ASPNN|nr:hypothetical protein FE257_008253 [Aspergillus nanangensis]